MPKSKPRQGRTAFVTVGTTRFDALMQAMTNELVLQTLQDLGFTTLILQHGKGPAPTLPPSNGASAPLHVEMYDFKPSLAADYQRADWVIGHAGAGTISETLAAGDDDDDDDSSKKQRLLILVINTALMHNHQTELAYAMRNGNYLYVVENPHDLLQASTWKAVQEFEPTPFPGGDAMDFPRLLTAFFNE